MLEDGSDAGRTKEQVDRDGATNSRSVDGIKLVLHNVWRRPVGALVAVRDQDLRGCGLRARHPLEASVPWVSLGFSFLE